jgi:hypothetical protein
MPIVQTMPSPTTTKSRLDPAVVIALGIALVLAALVPLALRADAELDRSRPMYDDRAHMEWLQYQNVVGSGAAVPGTVSGEQSLVVAGEEFRASAGVTVEVQATDPARPCVRASNDDGDVTEWACLDADDPPTDPDPPVDDTGL